MKLPEHVHFCLTRLESAGYPCYAVGGCVRDALLGLTPQDYDLCTAALPEETEAVFADYKLVLAGKKHGTVGVIIDSEVVEITTFRTEGGYQDHRHPDWVRFVPEIKEDLARRDFTVNAMAWSPTRGLQDPFGGEADLKNRVLRAVGDPECRFREDALRILRGLRFAARYGLKTEEQTLAAMNTLAPLMENLAVERVFSELCKLLLWATAEDLIAFAPILGQILPELDATRGFAQHSPHHVYDVFTHTAHVVAATPRELSLRWAALLHDLGKVPTFTTDETGRGHFYGHAEVSAQMAEEILHRLKAPTILRQQVVFLIRHHMTPLSPDRKLLRRWLSRYGKEALEQLLALQKADFYSKGVSGEEADFHSIETALGEVLAQDSCLSLKDLAVNGRDLMAMGITGPAIGQALNRLLALVLEERLPNEKEPLLEALRQNTIWGES